MILSIEFRKFAQPEVSGVFSVNAAAQVVMPGLRFPLSPRLFSIPRSALSLAQPSPPEEESLAPHLVVGKVSK